MNPTCRLTKNALLTIFIAFASHSYAENSEKQLQLATEHFTTGCSDDLLEKNFIGYFERVGIKGAASGDISLAYGIPGYMAATYYRKPLKCCISIKDVNFDRALSHFSHFFRLQHPKYSNIVNRKVVVFKPKRNDQLITMDWNSNQSGTSSITNICRVSSPQAELMYQKF